MNKSTTVELPRETVEFLAGTLAAFYVEFEGLHSRKQIAELKRHYAITTGALGAKKELGQ